MTVEQLELFADELDAHVAETPQIDRFCSHSGWILPARFAFRADELPFIFCLEHGWAPLLRTETPLLGRTLMPLEASWGMASPVLGRRTRKVCSELVKELKACDTEWDGLYLLGLERGGNAFTTLVHRFGPTHRLGLGHASGRRRASLAGGMEGWWSRRSAKFRKEVRKSVRRAEREGVVIEDLQPQTPEEALAVFERVVAVERRSWKGQEGVGFEEGRMHTFYQRMFPHLATRGRLQVSIATRDGADLAMVFGGTFGDTYRGLQLSFIDQHRELSLGNVLQVHTIGRCVEQGLQTYDLGQDMAYKERWAEQNYETVALVVR